ncbi:MAG: glycosyltransferase family 1 protein [Candidatus Paceibacterota bacterium]|jgi:glycosyltransferase involved in cell wall biosynthesis
MRIGIDYISALSHGGNATYSRELCRWLPRVASGEEFIFFDYVHDWLQGRPRERFPRVVYVPAILSAFGRKELIGVSDRVSCFLEQRSVRKQNIDVFHFTNPLQYRDLHCATVVTIHDLAPYHDSSWAKARSQTLLDNKLAAMIKNCRKFIAVSEFTKRDLVQYTNLAPEKISVIYEAANSDFYPDADRVHVERVYGLTNFILCVGQLQPRKNTLGLIEAYAGLPASLRKNFSLVFVGQYREREYKEKVEALIKKLRVNDHIVFLGGMKQAEMRKLYSCAYISTFPSLFEGFGLPVVESIACGTPVIVSNTSSLPEVAGTSCLLVDPHNVSQISATLERVLLDQTLYQNLKNNISQDAGRFSWKKTAEETLQTYDSILSDH